MTEDEEEEEDEEDEDYHEETAGKFSSVVAGSKRSADELSEGDAYGDEDDEAEAETEGQNFTKKARV